MQKVRVLIVDDSAVIRQVLTEILNSEPEFEVVGAAVDPFDARDKIKQLKPDVLTLDIEMPRMDGITFLRNLMKLNPMPVVMLSTLTHAGADETLTALEVGAVDFIAKPTVTASDSALLGFQQELIFKVKTAAALTKKLRFKRAVGKTVAQRSRNTALAALEYSKQQVIAIGASTGGTEAIREVLHHLPKNLPPIIITQHIPASFSARFAKRLNEQSELEVSEVKQGEVLKPGHAYIAPGSHHLMIKKQGAFLKCHLDDGEPVNRHKPSVEVMFTSLLGLDPSEVIAIMLTGMGDDGAKAMKNLKSAGAHTIVQDELSCLVWGMPKAAVECGAAVDVVDLHKIAPKLVQHLSCRG